VRRRRPGKLGPPTLDEASAQEFLERLVRAAAGHDTSFAPHILAARSPQRAAYRARVTKEVSNTDEFRGARFTRVNLAGTTFRDVDLSGAKFVDAVLVDADLSGLIV